mgnify:FL=1
MERFITDERTRLKARQQAGSGAMICGAYISSG